MSTSSSKQSTTSSTSYDQKLANYRSYQEEMTAISQEYSQQRQAVWSQEMEGMAAAWNGFQQDWQGTLAQMGGAPPPCSTTSAPKVWTRATV